MFKYLFQFCWFIFATILTQIGGIIWLLCMPLFAFIKKKVQHKGKALGANVLVFLLIYLCLTFTLIPALASALGRVPLPFWATSMQPLQPLNRLTYLLNRHYVTPQLYETISKVALQMQQQYPGTITAYLDANLPFINGFPLVPHLSHKDGKKLDLAFFYTNAQTQTALQIVAPSWIGYGGCELPKLRESNQTAICEKKGFWQYGILEKLFGKSNTSYAFDEERTRHIIQLLTADKRISKIFIEPHLKSRLGFSNNAKVRFHGCRSVRHDDHIHLQIR